MKKSFITICVIMILLCITGCDKISESEDKSETSSGEIDMDKLSYSLGVSIGTSLKNLDTEINLDILSGAIKDVFDEKELTISEEEANQFIQQSLAALKAKKSQEALKKGKDFLATNKDKTGVVTTESGLQYIVLAQGNGLKPGATDSVKVHYKGTFIDDTVFDNSKERGEPVTFPVNNVIPGWSEGIQLMNVGSNYKFFIPSELAYGAQGAGETIGPNEVLIFDVELLEIIQ